MTVGRGGVRIFSRTFKVLGPFFTNDMKRRSPGDLVLTVKKGNLGICTSGMSSLETLAPDSLKFLRKVN